LKGVAERPRDQGYERAFPEGESERPAQHGERRGDDDAQINLHADRDEKQTDQDVAKRSDIVFDLMAEIAFADDHAGEKAPIGGDSRALCTANAVPRPASGAKQEELRRARVSRPGQRRSKHRTSDDCNDDKGERRDEELAQERKPADFPASPAPTRTRNGSVARS
jgi:hypothetical protein